MKLSDLAAELSRGVPALLDSAGGPLREALTLAARTLERDPSQLAAQIAGRLSPGISAEIDALLEEARSAALVPVAASLEAPGGALLRVLSGHTNFVGSLAWLPDGKTLVSSSEDGSIRVWDAASGACRHVLDDHGIAVNCIALNKAGTRLASAADDHKIKVWDTATWKCLRTIEGHTNYVSKVVVTATDGLLTTSKDCTARLWDMETGKEFASFPFKQWITEAAITPDGLVAVVASTDNVMKVYDVQHAKEIRTLVDASAGFVTIPGFDLFIPGRNKSGVGHASAPHDVVFAPDGKTLLSVDKEVIAWDVETGKEKKRFGAFAWPVNALAADSRGLLWLGGGGVFALDGDGNEVARLFGHAEEVRSLAISPDGRTIASGSKDATIRLWDVETALSGGKRARHTHSVSTCRFSPDARIALTGANDGTARTWDVATGAPRHVLAHGTDPFVDVLAFTPGGERVVTTSHDASLAVWDAKSGACLHRAKHPGGLYSFTKIAITPDGTRGIAGEVGDRGLTLWHLDGATEPETFTGKTKFAQSLVLTKDGTRAIVTTYADDKSPGKIQIFDVASRKLVSEAEAPGPYYYPRLVLSGDERLAIAASTKGEVHVWDLSGPGDPRVVARAGTWEDAWPYALHLVPDGTVLRAAQKTGGGTAVRWVRLDATVPRTLDLPHGCNRGFTITADATRAALAHEESVQLVDLPSGRVLGTFLADSAVHAIAISADGSRVLAGEREGRLHVLRG